MSFVIMTTLTMQSAMADILFYYQTAVLAAIHAKNNYLQ